MTIPANARTAVVREAAQWRQDAATHAARADALTAGHRERRAAGERHPIDDFLYDYYGTRPGQLRRWHPGAGVVLRPAAGEPSAEHASWRWYGVDDGGAVTLDVDAFLTDRGDAVEFIRSLLRATASRPAFAGCLGLHEWAMVYRSGDARRRHDLPLRLGQAGTDAVVQSHAIRCSHVDAFRFFTPEAVERNALAPTRETQVLLEQPGCLHANMDLVKGKKGTLPLVLTRENQPDFEQPGCLHANMDLTKWSLKLGPAVPGDLLLDCFQLAGEIRTLDMQASPYDVSSLGESAVAIETQAGKAEYVTRQRAFAERAAVLRQRLIEVCDGLLARL